MMSDDQLTWEKHFHEAAFKVEEHLSSSDLMEYDKSKLRVALENKYISWSEYRAWYLKQHPVACLENLEELDIARIRQMYLDHKKNFDHYEVWDKDSLAFGTWDGHVLILGLEFNEKFNQVSQSIFYLCQPEIITSILSDSELSSFVVDESEGSKSVSLVLPNGLDEHTANISNINFSKLSLAPVDDKPVLTEKKYGEEELPPVEASADIIDNVNSSEEKTPTEVKITLPPLEDTPANPTEIKLEKPTGESSQDIQTAPVTTTIEPTPEEVNPDSLTYKIWKNVEDQHVQFSTQARKQFDAYIVLRITKDLKTELFKMDEDLEKELINGHVFNYDLKKDNPFRRVYNKTFTETFNLSQLGLNILDFKYACITAIKLGNKVVGFLVGFKTTNLSQDDISTLEAISDKAV